MGKSIIYEGSNQYFEAKIQLRPFDEEIYQFISKMVLERKGTHISKVVKLRGGVDIYISSQRFARTIGDQLKRKFKGWELKISRTLHTRDKLRSRDIYRGTVCFKKKEEKSE
tara:strand:- start:4257 stop:4592 length:336 start_codon:yes stop_codon:yes gene_type:complete